MELKCRATKKFVVTTDSKHSEPVAPNILNRQFARDSLNATWVSDYTCVKVGSKWNFLTVFMDLYSRIIIGWHLSESLDRHSMIHAFQKALWRRNPPSSLLVHSDRGVQYASADFRNLFRKNQFTQSMSRKGNCRYNAVTGSFFHTLKTQFLYHNRFHSKSDAEQALFNYIELYYNRGEYIQETGTNLPPHMRRNGRT